MTSLISGLLNNGLLDGGKDKHKHGYGHGGHHGGGYGHSGYGHSGYGHSGYGHSGYGHSGYGDEKEECCPLVIDALCLFAILGAIGAAALFLERVINIEIMMGGRRRKRSPPDKGLAEALSRGT